MADQIIIHTEIHNVAQIINFGKVAINNIQVYNCLK